MMIDFLKDNVGKIIGGIVAICILLFKWVISKWRGIRISRKDQIDNLSSWVDKSEHPVTSPFHRLQKKKNSNEFYQLKSYLTKQEKTRIDEIYQEAESNSNKVLKDSNYDSQPDNVRLIREFRGIVVGCLERQRKKWKLI